MNVNRGLYDVLRRHAREWSTPHDLERIRLPVDSDGDLLPLGVEFAINIEQLQYDLVPLAIGNIIAAVLLKFDKAAGIGLVGAAIEGPDRLFKGLPDLFLDMRIVVEPAALDEGFVLVRGAGPQERCQEDHPQEQRSSFHVSRGGQKSHLVNVTR